MRTKPFPCLGSLLIYSNRGCEGSLTSWVAIKGRGKANEATLQAHVCTHAHTHMHAHRHTATDDATAGAPQVSVALQNPMFLSCFFLCP